MSAPLLCSVGVVITFYTEKKNKLFNDVKYAFTNESLFFCSLIVSGTTNYFRVASSNSSLIAKSCACAYIKFIAGIFSWCVDCIYSTEKAAR